MRFAHSFFFAMLAAVAVPLCGLAQPAATTSSLTVSSTTPVWPQPVTLTAAVTAGTKAVSPGLVKFCNASASSCQGASLLAQAQLTGAGVATSHLVLPPGAHSVKAVFAGTSARAGSSSAAQTITVMSGAALAPSINLTASGQNPYVLTATVTSPTSNQPAGNIRFVDYSTGYLTLGTAALTNFTTKSTFTPQILASTGSEPIPMITGDFNNDGLPDIAAGNINATNGIYTVSVFLSGAWQSPVPFQLPASWGGISALATADFNGDGNLDLVILDPNSNQALIAYGNGSGQFTPAIVLPTGFTPVSVAVADLNNDGVPDLAIANRSSSNVSVFLSQGYGNFVAVSQTPATGYFPYAMVAGDLNNDGKQDLAIANYFDNSVTVLLGNGDGTFTAAASPATGVYPDGMALGDFNRDGNQDLAVSNQFSQTVTVLLGNGKGGFTPTTQTLVTGRTPQSVSAGDLNGDGLTDLVTANANDNNLSIWYGKGDGTFAAGQPVSLPAGSAPAASVVADFNGDGYADLAATASGNNTVAVFEKTVATSGEATIAGVQLGGRFSHALYAFDLTTDTASGTIGLPGSIIPSVAAMVVEPNRSVAVGDTVQVSAVISPVIGTLAATGPVAIYNGTTLIGNMNLVNGAGVLNYKLAAAGTYAFSAHYGGDNNYTPANASSVSLTAVQIAASVVSLSAPTTAVAHGTPVPLTASVTSNGAAVKTGTVTFCRVNAKLCTASISLGSAQLNPLGMAKIELPLPDGTTPIHALFLGNAVMSGSISNTQNVTVTGMLTSSTALAVTGAQGNYTLTSTVTGSWPAPQGQVSIVDKTIGNAVLASASLQPGTPQFAQSASVPVTGTGPIVSADLNGDGKADLVVPDQPANTVHVLLGNGAGGFTTVSAAIPAGAPILLPISVNTGDFNDDGIPDLAVYCGAYNEPGQVVILLGKGDGTFTVKAVIAEAMSPAYGTVGDFNGDGIDDLAFGDQSENRILILLGNGDGTFVSDPAIVTTSFQPFGLVAADFNGDGILDIAVSATGFAGRFTGGVTIYSGNGDGTFSGTALSYSTGMGAALPTVCDVNGDGLPDLAVPNFGDSTLTILINKGAGIFGVNTIPLAANQEPTNVVAGDFNGDGIEDLLVSTDAFVLFANPNALRAELLLGSPSGVFTPVMLPIPGAVFVVSADFNGDGGPDVAAITATGIGAWLNSASGTATFKGLAVPGSGSHQVEAIYSPLAPYAGSTSALQTVTAGAVK